MFQINTDFLIVQLKKTFLQKSSCTPPSFHKKERCPSQGFPEISTFYHIFTSFQSEWSVEYFKQNNNIITLETLHPSFNSSKNWRILSEKLSETSTFYHIFTIFNSTWDVEFFK